jgi:ATP-dependent helicase YprA (DUF1998 family)
MWVTFPAGLPPTWQPPQPTADEKAEADEGEDEEGDPLGDALHAIQHLAAGVMPLLVMCDRRDVDGSYHVAHPDLGLPAVFLYDVYEGGIGLAEIAYQRAGELLRLAHDTVSRCTCAGGCPSCIQAGGCRLRNESLNKGAAIALLGSLFASGGRVAGAGGTGAKVLQKGPQRALPASVVDRTPSGKRALEELLERTRQSTVRRRLEAVPESETPAERAAPQTPEFAKGDWVEQSPYGRGQVLAARVEDGREIVRVRFMRRGMVREIDASKTPLRKVE